MKLVSDNRLEDYYADVGTGTLLWTRELARFDRQRSEPVAVQAGGSQETAAGPPHGWAKIYSTAADRQGVLNIEWDSDTGILLCRVINRGAGRPNLIVGDFVDYLLRQFRRRIEAITIIPR